jgi:hypothetical protein
VASDEEQVKRRRVYINHFLKQTSLERFLSILSVILLCLGFSACTSVDTIMLTSESFPPKGTTDEVAVLQAMPTRPHQELAELRVGDSWFSFGSLQRKILDKAAALGADAVVFAKPQTQVQHQVAYEPLYDQWGYDSPYYGPGWGYSGGGYGGWGYGSPYGLWSPWGGGYSGVVAVPYDEVIRMLMGTAIRYTNGNEPS